MRCLVVLFIVLFYEIIACEPPVPNEEGVIYTEDYFNWRNNQ